MSKSTMCPNPNCRNTIQVEQDQLEQEIRCPRCQQSFVVSRMDDAVLDQTTGHTASSLASSGQQSLPKRIGRFEVSGFLGEGAFGRVYRAYDRQLEREVAVKVAIPETMTNPKAVRRFLSEARAAAGLCHPNIVPLYDAGKDESDYYIAARYISGRTLENALENGKFAFNKTVVIIRTLAAALCYAHTQGIVHRDIKPANVMVDLQEQPLLMDFGLAQREADGSTSVAEGAVSGTPLYMSPEQWNGQAEAASDQYSLGVMFYQMLCGSCPFTATTRFDMMRAHVKQPPPPLRDHDKGIPRDLEAICLKMLAKTPEVRYGSCQELAEDLERYLEGEPVLARPVGRIERAHKWARREPAQAIAVGGGIMAALCLVAAIASFALFKLQQAWVLEEKLARALFIEEERERISKTLLRAQEHEAARRWTDADTELASAQGSLGTLQDLRADELRAEIDKRRESVRQRLEEQTQQQQARQRLQAFRKPYDDALFHQTLFTGMGQDDDREKTLTAIRAALANYGLSEELHDTWRLSGDRAHLDAAEYTWLTGACYELLLIWADVVGTPVPGQPEAEEETRKRARQALVLLSSAEAFGKAHNLNTRAYHLRQARYQALDKGEQFDPNRLDPATPRSPNGPLDWFLAGLEDYRAGQYDSASQACREVLSRQGDHFWARYVLALCHLRAGRWVEGKAELTVCSNARPEFTWPRLLRGFAASELGFQHREKPLADAEFRLAEADFDAVLQKDQETTVQYVGLANRGVLHIRRGHWKLAIRDFDKAVKVNPKGFQAHVNLSQALQAEGKLTEALQALDAALSAARVQAPDMAAVLFQSRAKLHLLRRDPQRARADFEMAISCEPTDSRSERLVNSLVELGRLLHGEGKYPQALARFDRALELRPNFILAERFRSETLLALNRDAEAALALDRYLAVTPTASAVVYQARGLMHAKVGQVPAAITMYSMALSQHPRDVATRCLRGWAYLLNDAVRLALADFEACLKDDPTSTDALIGRGNARVRLRQLNEALADARAAQEQGRLTDRLSFNLACIYAQAFQIEGEISASRSPRSTQRTSRHEERAVQFLRETLEQMPKARRPDFWRRQVEIDPALAPIRQGSPYLQLARQVTATPGV